MKLKVLFTTLIASAAVTAAQAQTTLALWNFNSPTADTNTATGTLSPSTGSGTLSLVGGVTSTFASGSPGDTSSATDNSGLNLTTWSAQGTGSGTRGLQVATSTAGFSGISISLDFRQSGTVSRYFQLQVSADGINFNNVSGGTTSLGTIGTGNTATTFGSDGLYSDNPGSGSQTFVQTISYSLAPGSIYENDANFAFRWVAVFEPVNGTNYISANAGTAAAYAATGTGRFDNVTVTGIVAAPEPSTLALTGCGLAVLIGFRRFKNNRS